MRLENVLALTHGKLISKPFVSSFTETIFEAKNVKRGDLFIAFNEDEIEEAILNGAYGIIFDKPTQIIDNEIAWIKVNNIDDAFKKLLRFRLIQKNISTYSCDLITLKLALQIFTETSFYVLKSNTKITQKQLWNLSDASTILFSPELYDENIFTNIQPIESDLISKIELKERTLFETSFIYDHIFYDRVFLSPFFIPYLEKILNFFKKIEVNFRLKSFTQMEHFEAVFVNNSIELKEFGTTDKVLIFEKNLTLVKDEIEFLKKFVNWANLIFVLPADFMLFDLKEYTNIFFYKNKDEIFKILKENSFNFALIAGSDKSIVKESLRKSYQPTLF